LGANSANGHVSIVNNSGGILGGGAATIETVASGSNISDAIGLNAYNGGAINVGSILSGGGAVNLATSGGGNITLASLTGLSSYGGLGAVNINSSGSLAFSAGGNIYLYDSSGNIVAGNLSTSSSNDVGSATGYIAAYSGGSLQVGSVSTS